jgi:hypothetical protein
MSKDTKNIELKEIYKDGTTKTREFEDFIFIGMSVDQKEDRIDVHINNKLNEIYYAHVAIEQMKKIIKEIEKSIGLSPTSKLAFDITSKIFSAFEEEGLEGIKKTYKNRKLKITKDEYEYLLKTFKNVPRPEVRKG